MANTVRKKRHKTCKIAQMRYEDVTGSGDIPTRFLTLALDTAESSAELVAVLSSGKHPGLHRTGGSVGLFAGLDAMTKIKVVPAPVGKCAPNIYS
jgi:hypothetical protein